MLVPAFKIKVARGMEEKNNDYRGHLKMVCNNINYQIKLVNHLFKQIEFLCWWCKICSVFPINELSMLSHKIQQTLMGQNCTCLSIGPGVVVIGHDRANNFKYKRFLNFCWLTSFDNSWDVSVGISPSFGEVWLYLCCSLQIQRRF